MTTKIIGHSGTIVLAIEHLQAGLNGGGDHIDLHLNTAAALIQSVMQEREAPVSRDEVSEQERPTGHEQWSYFRDDVRNALLRASKKSSQQEVAKDIGVAGSTVNRLIKAGEGSDDMYLRVAKHFGINPPA